MARPGRGRSRPQHPGPPSVCVVGKPPWQPPRSGPGGSARGSPRSDGPFSWAPPAFPAASITRAENEISTRTRTPAPPPALPAVPTQQGPCLSSPYRVTTPFALKWSGAGGVIRWVWWCDRIGPRDAKPYATWSDFHHFLTPSSPRVDGRETESGTSSEDIFFFSLATKRKKVTLTSPLHFQFEKYSRFLAEIFTKFARCDFAQRDTRELPLR